MPENFAEKRKSVRVPVDFPASFRKGDNHYEGNVLNLSVDGLFLKSQQPFRTNDRIHVSFQLPASAHALHLTGQVMWGRSIPDARNEYGMGIHFEEISHADSAELHAFIQKLLKT